MTPYLNDMENLNVFQRLYAHQTKPRAYAQPGIVGVDHLFPLLYAFIVTAFFLIVLKTSTETEIDENCTFRPQIDKKGCPFLSPRSERRGVQRTSGRSKRSVELSPSSLGLPAEEGIMIDELGGAMKVL